MEFSKKIIFLIICAIYIIYYKFIKKKQKSKFWKYQPVSRTYQTNTKNYKIKETTDISINNNLIEFDTGKYEFVYFNLNNKHDLNTFYNFIKNNYVKDEYYSKEFLRWSFMINNKKKLNKLLIGLIDKTNKMLIATISAKPVILSINYKIYKTTYVSFLCVKKDIRNKSVAAIIISEVIRQWQQLNYDFKIFLIDNKPLEFDYVKKYYYNVYEIINPERQSIININIQKVDKSKLNKAYIFMTKHMKQYSVFQVIDYNEFKHISTKFGNLYAIYNNDKIVGLLYFIKTAYNSNKISVAMIQYILLKQGYSIGDIITDIFKLLYILNYKYVIFLEDNNNNKYNNQLPVNSKPTYLHSYNYAFSSNNSYMILHI